MLISLIVFWKEDDTKDIIRSLNSIIKQPCKEYEVIIIDCKYDSRESIRGFFPKNQKVSYYACQNDATEMEQILFSREKAAGDYLQFMDSGDYLQVDWLYQIMRHIEKSTDLIIGSQNYIRNESELFYFNFSINRYLKQGRIEKNKFLNIYLMHGGENRALLSLNNKVIKTTLLSEILKNINFIEINNIYAIEYLVFCLFCQAKEIWNEKETNYIYNIKKEWQRYFCGYEKCIDDLEQFLSDIESQLYTESKEKVDQAWKREWYKELYKRLTDIFPDKQNEISKRMNEKAGEKISVTHETSFFESASTVLGESYQYYEQMKEFIASEECEYVGFDIFDTLIQRPFWEPTDLFYLLNDKFNELLGEETCIDFSLMRKNGESACRGYYSNVRPSNEDVTLDEIYCYISDFYGIDRKITDELEKYEIQLELKYCRERKIGKELFDWAGYCGKIIFIASDMYLPIEIIRKILEQNGLNGYQKLYLSNDIGISKYSGSLFDYIIKDLGIEDFSSVCFIGDNYGVDFVNSQKRGMIPFHVPKATELFQGMNGAIYSGKFFEKIYQPNGGIIDQGTVMKFIGIRCMMAVVANQIYGNPFVNFNKESDFNADPEFIGYYCAGMFLFAEAKWLILQSCEREIKTIHFVSRDGFYIKKAYDKLHTIFKEGAASNYLYFSRKAVAPLFLGHKEGIYELFLPPHVLSQTPESVVKLLEHVVIKDKDCKRILKEAGIAPEKKFRSMHEFYIFAKVFEEKLYDEKAAKKYSDMLYRHFKRIIQEGDVICDVGYSGRMETALTKLLGFPVSSYYFHEHEPWALMRKRSMNFHIESFYSFKPCSAFVLREQLFTPSQASCIGFEEKEGSVQPVFGTYHAAFKEEFILDIIQNSSIRFIEDMLQIFGTDLKMLDFNRFDACIPLEYYLHYAKKFDRKVLSAIAFEDEFGTNAVMSMQDYWIKESKTYLLSQEPKVVEKVVVQREPVNEQEIREEIRAEIINNERLQAGESIYSEGIYVKLFRSLNKLLPIGSRRRNFVKRIAGVLIH